ncbi:MAG: hypothetical protein ACI4TK_08875 [Agathobacter sp.]
MDDLAVRKSDILQSMSSMKFYPVLAEDKTDMATCIKLPLSKLPSVGIALEPLAAAVQNILNCGSASGIYRVTVPAGTHLAEFKNGVGNLGTALNANNQIAGQAVLNPLVCNPTTIFMAAALAGIDQKLGIIQETQQEMLDFLIQKEKSDLEGDLKFLNDILNNYKFNWNSEKYISANYIKVLDIRQSAEKKIDFYRKHIISQAGKNSLLHSDQSVQKQVKKVGDDLKSYQLALYIYSFSYFLEIMLQENFDAGYLSNISQRLEDYALQYRELYTECYDRLDAQLKSSVQSRLSRGVSSAGKATGEYIASLPLISKSPIDEALVSSSERIAVHGKAKASKTMSPILDKQSSYIRPFIENINTINTLYNHPINMFFDEENIYLESAKESTP